MTTNELHDGLADLHDRIVRLACRLQRIDASASSDACDADWDVTCVCAALRVRARRATARSHARLGPLELTHLELEILRHRLEIPDAIAEALGPDGDDMGYAEDDVHAVVNALHALDWTLATTISEDITRDVLIDCVTGATWVACMIGEFSEQLIARHGYAGQRLADKISAHYEIEPRLAFPWE